MDEHPVFETAYGSVTIAGPEECRLPLLADWGVVDIGRTSVYGYVCDDRVTGGGEASTAPGNVGNEFGAYDIDGTYVAESGNIGSVVLAVMNAWNSNGRATKPFVKPKAH